MKEMNGLDFVQEWVFEITNSNAINSLSNEVWSL